MCFGDGQAQWRGGRGGGGGQGGHALSDSFLGALKFAIANVKYLTKYVKSSFCQLIQSGSNSGISIAIQ